MTGEALGERQRSEKIRRGLVILEPHTRQDEPGFQAVTAAKPVDELLILLHVILEPGMPPLRLRNAGDADSRKADVEQPVDVRQVVREADEPQILNDLFAQDRSVERVVIISDAEARFENHRWTQRMRNG